jgi:hypothetical protein
MQGYIEHNEDEENRDLHLAKVGVEACAHGSYSAALAAATRARASGLAAFNSLIAAIGLHQNGEEGKGDHKSEDDLRDELHDDDARVISRFATA